LVSRQAALAELLAGKGSAYQEPDHLCKVVRYDPGKTLWPQLAGFVFLPDCLPESERTVFTVDSNRFFMPASEFEGGVVEDVRAYWDETLRRDGRAYFEFVQQMQHRKMITFCTEVKEHVVFGSVSDKSDNLRLVVDARRPNRTHDRPSDPFGIYRFCG
jgi:hypothetical protein